MKFRVATAIGILLLVLVVLGGYLVGRHNNLSRAGEDVDNAWSLVKVRVQRRASLIPDLVEAVKDHAGDADIGKLTDARSRLTDDLSPAQTAEIDADIGSAVKRLLPHVEDHADYATNDRIQELQKALEGAGNLIAMERRNYNESARAFNASLEGFPNDLVASIFGLSPRELCEAKDRPKEPIKIGF